MLITDTSPINSPFQCPGPLNPNLGPLELL